MTTQTRILASILAWAALGAGCGASTATVDSSAGAAGLTGVAGSPATAGGSAGDAGAASNAASGTANTGGVAGAAGAGGENTSGGGSAGSAVGEGGAAGATAGGGAGGAAGLGGGSAGGAAGGAGGPSLEDLDPFSFFVTSQVALIALAPDENGFGGDLRYGEATGLAGADKICTEIAESSMPGSSIKQWRAYLSTTAGGENDGPVNAIERIGTGPWYDRNGRLIANDVAGLMGVRPDGDPQAVMDFANETGEPNHAPGGVEVDNHDTLTGSDDQGLLASTNPDDTCGDWTRNDMPLGSPMLGHSWPRNENNLDMGANWMSEHDAQGCLAKVNTESDGGGPDGCNGVGCGGGYGGIYCFALNP